MFQHLTLAFDMTWKDMIVIFNQTLSDPEYIKVLKESHMYAMELHKSSDKHLAGETSVPSSDHSCNYDPEHILERDNFLICVKPRLKAAQQNVISYVRVTQQLLRNTMRIQLPSWKG